MGVHLRWLYFYPFLSIFQHLSLPSFIIIHYMTTHSYLLSSNLAGRELIFGRIFSFFTTTITTTNTLIQLQLPMVSLYFAFIGISFHYRLSLLFVCFAFSSIFNPLFFLNFSQRLSGLFYPPHSL